MPIGSAVQRGSTVYIYDEKGRQIGSVPAGDGLQGYASGSVSVKSGSRIIIYDEKGRQTGSAPAR